ncbi:MAG TPA: hypothetical protein VFZ11_14550 [Gemmatimonadaceae bacterium]
MMRDAGSSRRRGRRGAALLAALAMLVAISLVALEMGTASRASRLAAANALDRAAARAAAHAGLAVARARLRAALRANLLTAGAPAAPDPWAPLVGIAIAPAGIGALEYEVELRDAGRRLDLNRADETQLGRVLAQLGVDAARAERAAQGIADWRDGDDLRRGRGAERADYIRLGRPVLPGNAPFRNADELREVVGVDAALFAALRPLVTTVGLSRVNLNAADGPVLAALPGMSPECVALVLRRRRAGQRIGSPGELAAALSASARERLLRAMPELLERSTSTTDVVEVVVTVRDAAGVTRERLEALVARDAGPRVVWTRMTP